MAEHRRKTDPNHKATFSFGARIICSCGWQSSTWYGKGARGNASGEWHGHRDLCGAATATEGRS